MSKTILIVDDAPTMRQMVNFTLKTVGHTIEEAGPSVPVEVLGLNGTPLAGDALAVVENDARAREIADFRRQGATQMVVRQIELNQGCEIAQFRQNVSSQLVAL